MADTRSASGRPLAGSTWLAAHHKAKRPERQAFCRRLASLRPTRVVDLGCATGLWLDELDKVVPRTCEFIGIDSDETALSEARERAATWQRSARFDYMDLELAAREIPEADLILVFNLATYLPNLDELLSVLASSGAASSHVGSEATRLRVNCVSTFASPRLDRDARTPASLPRHVTAQFLHATNVVDARMAALRHRPQQPYAERNAISRA